LKKSDLISKQLISNNSFNVWDNKQLSEVQTPCAYDDNSSHTARLRHSLHGWTTSNGHTKVNHDHLLYVSPSGSGHKSELWIARLPNASFSEKSKSADVFKGQPSYCVQVEMIQVTSVLLCQLQWFKLF